MNINYLTRKSWSCMSFAIRMMTLVAFTAHAVLGCCLSHGSCMREQAAVLTEHCCDHTALAVEVHNHDENHTNTSHEHGDELVQVTSSLSCNNDLPGHSNHCDDVSCIFGVSSVGGNAAELLTSVHAIWITSPVDFWRHTSMLAGYAPTALPSHSRALSNRSILQVWLI